MTESFKPIGQDEDMRRIAEAAAALDGLREPAERAAAAIEDAFGRAAESLATSLGRAAADGEISLAELARAVITAANSAGGGKGGGLSAALSSAVSHLFGGSRADGGPVARNGAYLVGERGPEVFRPASAGTIEAVSGAAVTINVSVGGDAKDLLRSETQIARMLARAVALGARRI